MVKKQLTSEQILKKNLSRNLLKLENIQTKKPHKQKMGWCDGRRLPIVEKGNFISDGSFSCSKHGIIKKRIPEKKKPIQPEKKLTIKQAFELFKKSQKKKLFVIK